MKFKVELEIEIDDTELLELINSDRVLNDKEEYDSLEEIPKSEIYDWLDDSEYIKQEIEYYGIENPIYTII